MKFWIARDADNDLYLYTIKPIIINKPGYQCWIIEDGLTYKIDDNLFPEVTFENSPQQVEIKLINNG